MNHTDFLLLNPTQIEIYFTEPTKVLQNILSEPLLNKANPWGFFALKQLDQNKTTRNDSLGALVLAFMSPCHTRPGEESGGKCWESHRSEQSAL